MHMVVRLLALLVFLALAGPAHAGRVTVGSDLKSDATVTLHQGADTAYWGTREGGSAIEVPVDGQVVQIRIKGAAITEEGAGPPANLVHFQSLNPAKANGAREVYLTSAMAEMPIDQPRTITSFEPENLCVKKGGAVAFNTIGGFMWGGSLGAPLDPAHYHRGTPWRIFAPTPARRATTAWFSKDEGTKNGHTLVPRGGTGARDGYGRTMRGRELLMQAVIATGQDRSEPCGGPRRHSDGTLVEPKKRELRVAGGDEQRPYVTKDRRFTTGVYCETPGQTCRGKAILEIGDRTVDEVDDLSVPTQSSRRVQMRLPQADFDQLDRQGFLRVTYVLISQFGRTQVSLSLNR